MNRILNLRQSYGPATFVLEKVVVQKKIWWHEALKMLCIVMVVSSIVYAVSHAEVSTKPRSKNFSAIGMVMDIDSATLSLDDAHSSDGTGETSYSFDTGSVTKIQDADYTPLTLADIKIGDKLIVQGVDDGGGIVLHRIIDMSFLKATTATTTTQEIATSTDVVTATSTATTTDSLASSTPSISSSTPSGSNSDSATTTDATTTDSVASSTPPDISSSTPTVNPPDASSTPDVPSPDAPPADQAPADPAQNP